MFRYDPNNPSNLTPVLVAGGGGGSAGVTVTGANFIGMNASLSTSGTVSQSGGTPGASGQDSCGQAGGKGWLSVMVPSSPLLNIFIYFIFCAG